MNKNLKIAIIGSRGYPYVYSGYETLIKELSERLVKKGHKVRVYCHSQLFEKKPKFLNGVELVYMPSIETKYLSQFFNSFFSTLHFCFSSFDVGFYVNSANGPFGIFTKIFRKKTCINVDGLEWLRPKWKGLGSIYFRFSSKLSTILFDFVITDSTEMKNIYKNLFSKSSITIAYGSSMLSSTNKNKLKKYKVNQNEYYLIVGRLIPDNNAKIIIDGFLNTNSNKKLVIVGDVPYKDNYASEIKKIKSNKIICTGYINCQDELSQLYNNCFGYIHGHKFGGTNPTMINALKLNCEILSIDTVFTREMLKKRKVIYFNPDPDSIAKSFLDFESKIDFFKKINRGYKLPKKYDWNNIVLEYEIFFKSLVN